MNFDQRRLFTLIGTVVLAGVVVAAGIWGPSVWKAMRQQPEDPNGQVVIQTPPVDQDPTQAAGDPNVPADQTGGTDNSNSGNTPTSSTTTSAAPGTVIAPPDTSGSKKYKEPDTTQLDLAPSIAAFFGPDALSDAAKTVAYGAAWNIHQYVDGYLYGPTAGPQMNEADIAKYIVFHKQVWSKQIQDEPNAGKATGFTTYLDVLFNRGIDAFDSKDKARIEQFHQEIHDLDARLFRNDLSSKIYGATPFATKR